MKSLFILVILLNFSFAHKVNLFITEEEGKLDIYSYFANGAACQNCTLIIKNGENIILQDTLNIEGKYQYKPINKNIEVLIYAGNGHMAKKEVSVESIQHQDIQTHQQQEQDKKYLSILLGLFLIFIIFFTLKKIKK